MDLAIYYDYRLKDIGSETLKDMEPVIDFLKPQFKVIGYYEIEDWLKTHGEGDLLVFFQDVIPYTAFNAEYTQLFDKSNNLYQFIKRGGNALWLGYVPFFYRIRCGNFDIDINKIEERYRKFIKSIRLSENEICYRDIVSNAYIMPNLEVKPISTPTKYLGFIDISNVCYSKQIMNAEKTLMTKFIETSFQNRVKNIFDRTYRPHKFSHSVVPLNTVDLSKPFCKGRHYGAWIGMIGKGHFIRLLDYAPHITKEDILSAVTIAVKITELSLTEKYTSQFNNQDSRL